MNNSKASYGENIYVTDLKVTNNEILKLSNGLIKRGIAFIFRRMYGGYQIIAKDQTWDVICHECSYGGNLGLLEIMGKYVHKTDDTVEGYLTADEILKRIDEGVD